MTRVCLCSCLFALLAMPSAAQFPGPLVTDLEFTANTDVSLIAVPDGSGQAFSEASAYGGGVVDATIRIRIVDQYLEPIVGYPRDHVWLQFPANAGTAASCPDVPGLPAGAFPADVDTDADGWTEWARPLRGGGWSEGPALIYVEGFPAQYDNWYSVESLPVRLLSPDIDGDLKVNLTDLVYFASDYFGAYTYRSDLSWDGCYSLSDIVRLVPAIGATCP